LSLIKNNLLKISSFINFFAKKTNLTKKLQKKSVIKHFFVNFEKKSYWRNEKSDIFAKN